MLNVAQCRRFCVISTQQAPTLRLLVAVVRDMNKTGEADNGGLTTVQVRKAQRRLAHMEVIGYIRVVPKEDAAAALAHQSARIEQYCTQRNYCLTQVFKETLSADVPFKSRPILQQTLETAKSGMAVVVVRLDRISGDNKVLQEVFDQCMKKGIKLLAVGGPRTPQEMKSSLEVTVETRKQDQ